MGVADKPWTGGNSLLYGGFVAVRACGSLMGEDMRRDKSVGTGNGVALAFGVGANDRDVVTGSVAVETPPMAMSMVVPSGWLTVLHIRFAGSANVF